MKIFTSLGAVAAARITGQKMRQLGIRSIPAGPRIATQAHRLGLTRREREALDLICAGHTNAQIAAGLFISAKTAGHHVLAVLAELGAPPVRSPLRTLPGSARPAPRKIGNTAGSSG
ncbi:MAG: LuxR C-terminal-related transcriptional regulator [Acetobacteraceae bacterium]